MKPPKCLKKMGKQLWEDWIGGWEIKPEQLVLLQDLCESQDRMTELSRILRQEGQIFKDRLGTPRAHPATALLNREVGNFTRLYKALAQEAPEGSDVRPGRPSRPRWRRREEVRLPCVGAAFDCDVPYGQPGEPISGSGRHASQQDGHDLVLQPQPSRGETCCPGKSAPASGSRRNAGTNAGTEDDSVRTQVDWELACYDGLAANPWALNSH